MRDKPITIGEYYAEYISLMPIGFPLTFRVMLGKKEVVTLLFTNPQDWSKFLKFPLAMLQDVIEHAKENLNVGEVYAVMGLDDKGRKH